MVHNFKQYTSIGAVKGAQENNEFIFTENERDLFNSSLVKTAQDAIEVAE